LGKNSNAHQNGNDTDVVLHGTHFLKLFLDGAPEPGLFESKDKLISQTLGRFIKNIKDTVKGRLFCPKFL